MGVIASKITCIRSFHYSSSNLNYFCDFVNYGQVINVIHFYRKKNIFDRSTVKNFKSLNKRKCKWFYQTQKVNEWAEKISKTWNRFRVLTIQQATITPIQWINFSPDKLRKHPRTRPQNKQSINLLKSINI